MHSVGNIPGICMSTGWEIRFDGITSTQITNAAQGPLTGPSWGIFYIIAPISRPQSTIKPKRPYIRPSSYSVVFPPPERQEAKHLAPTVRSSGRPRVILLRGFAPRGDRAFPTTDQRLLQYMADTLNPPQRKWRRPTETPRRCATGRLRRKKSFKIF